MIYGNTILSFRKCQRWFIQSGNFTPKHTLCYGRATSIDNETLLIVNEENLKLTL